MGGPPDPTTLARPWLASYPPGVPPTYQLPTVAVTRFLDDAARDFPERTALVIAKDRPDHATLRLRVDTVATALRARGIGAGTGVLVALPVLPATPVVLLALWRLGAVAVPVDPGAPEQRLRAIVGLARPDAVVGTGDALRMIGAWDDVPDILVRVTGDEWSAPGRLARVLPARLRGGAGRRSSTDGAVTLTELLDATDLRTVPAPPPWDAPAVLLADARAALPEPVVLTHANLVAASFLARLWVPDIQAGREVVVVGGALHEPAALTVGWLAGLLAGATVVPVEDDDPAALARAIERDGATVLVTSPPRVEALSVSGDVRRRDLTCLRVVLAAGEPLDPGTAAGLERRTAGARVRGLFGPAEACGLALAQPVYGRVEPRSSGLPVTTTVAAVVDPDHLDTPLPTGTPGRLVVHGPQVATDAWGPAGGEPRLVGGWLVTDAIATVDDDGVFTVLGRDGEVVVEQGTEVDR